MPSSRNQVIVDLRAVSHNYNAMESKVKAGVKLLAMVKGDAYGHGMVEVARALYASGCRYFGVAEIGEGVKLRQASLRGKIFVMVGTSSDNYSHYFTHGLTPVIYGPEGLELLAKEAQRIGQKIGVHLKVDTGMCRLGCKPGEAKDLYLKIHEHPQLYPAGIMSHLPCSDEYESAQTHESLEIFIQTVKGAQDGHGIISHIANSGGVLNFPRTQIDMVRPGISLYGYYPDGGAGRIREKRAQLLPAMTYRSEVLQIKNVAIGTGVSYGHTYVTKRQTRLAVIPVGYEDGYPRNLSNCGEVLIGGQRAKIRGRVCMNLCMVDITDIGNVEVGDEVVLMGTQGSQTITADDIAALSGTISYEVLCMIGNNNERSYIQ